MRIIDFNRLKRCLVFFLAIILAIPIISIPTAVHAATSFSDLRDHWAEQYIKTAVSKGFVSGYPDAKFRPDKDVSRAEFTSMINKALGNTGTVSVSFTDVPSNEWYYNDIQKGMSASFVGGYDDNTFRPNAPVTRQEAAVMISRLIPTYGSNTNLQSYPDYTSVSDWATAAMSKVCGKKYMGAYKDGKLHPLDNLTRAQTAKILCDILNSETIVTGTTTVRSNGTTLSNQVYTNDVVLHSDLGDGEATLSNCTVLGTLYVYGGGNNTVTVKNSRVANAVIEKSSSSVRLLASGESVIANTTAAKTAILETSSLSGGLYGSGYTSVNVKASADTTLKGSFGRVNVNGSSAKVDLASGAITTLNVDSAGRNSDITIGSSANVTTANVNGSAAFHGTGSISTMNANTADITYETKPKTVKGSYNPNSGSATLSNDNISINPKNGATDVDVDDDIVLTFNSATTKYNGTSLSSSNIEDVIQLRKKTSTGSTVDFKASINSAKKVITITPEDDLSDDTKYYVTIDKNALKIGSNGNSSFSSYFTTDDDGSGGSSTMDGITISPKKGATDVDVDTEITLTFDSAVTKYNGGSLSSSNIEDYIELHRKSESGTEINFEAEINTSKKITITPDNDLDEDTKYYVTIDKNQLKFNGSGNSKFTSYFTTGDESNSDITFSPKKGATGNSLSVCPTIKFSSAIETSAGKDITKSYLGSSVIIFREGSDSGSKVSFSAEINSSDKTITVTPSSKLKAGQKYYLGIAKNKLRTKSNEKDISETGVTWTTEDNTPTVSFSPSNGTSSVGLSSNIILYFSQNIYDTSGNTPNSSYITSYIAIRDNTSGSNINYAVSSISNTGFILAPSSNLISGHSYTVSIPSSKFKNSSSVYLSAASATFTAMTNVDTSSIDTAISSANAAKSNVQVSSSGSDILETVYWVTSAQLSALNSAISTASSAKSTVTTTAQAQNAASTLDTATRTFTANKKLGTKVKANTSALTYAIQDANAAMSGIQKSSDGFDISPTQNWAMQSDFDILNNAISVASALVNTADTYDKVSAGAQTLNAAVTTFKSKIRSGNKANKSGLESAINAATAKMSNVRIQTDGSQVPVKNQWVTQAEYDALGASISSANALIQKRDATQSELDTAAAALTKATNDFQPHDGTKTDTTTP